MRSPSVIGAAKGTVDAPEKERRRSSRYLCNGSAEVLVFHPECLFRGDIRDVSQSGCFVATRAKVHLECLADAEIRFRLNNRLFKTRVRLMSIRPDDGVGLEFLGVSARTREQLGNLIQELNGELSGKELTGKDLSSAEPVQVTCSAPPS